MKYIIKILFVVGLLSSLSPASWADRIKDLHLLQGARSNQLIGYGLVVGLAGTEIGTKSPSPRRVLKPF